METITLTPRFTVVLSRYFKVYRENIIKKGLKIQRENLYTFNYGKITCLFFSEKNKHEEYCVRFEEEKQDNTVYNKECLECGVKNGITYSLHIDYKINKHRTILEEVQFTEDTTQEEMEEKLKILANKKYDFCKCGSVAFEENLCKGCFIHSYTRSEEEGGDCPICYENKGRWAEFSACKHQFHFECITKLEFNENYIKKCPLCRTASDYEIDPFDQ